MPRERESSTQKSIKIKSFMRRAARHVLRREKKIETNENKGELGKVDYDEGHLCVFDSAVLIGHSIYCRRVNS